MASWKPNEKSNIRLSQKEQLTCMLQLQCEGPKSSDTSFGVNENDEHPWKVLVYDKVCQAILAPLFSVQELQSHGVTLYLLIDSKRQKVPNVPALYFVVPTVKNLDIIANDMSQGLYDRFYLNFSMGLDRKNLEYLANQLIDSNSYHRLSKVYDQYVNFVSLTPNLFDLNISNCYPNLHRTGPDRDNIIISQMEEITQSLFCSIVTLKKIPIIRSQKGSAAQRIAESLANKLSKHLQSRNNLFSQSGNAPYQNRPVLILLDRSIDFAQVMHHSPIYHSLLHDLLNLRHNIVEIPSEDELKKETILLDHDDDRFWSENALKPFPSVHVAHDNLLQWYKDKQDEMKHNPTNSNSNNSNSTDINNINSNGPSGHDLLKQAISLVPEVVKRKEEIDRHFKLLKTVSELLGNRSISDYFHLEDTLLHKQAISSGEETDLENQLQYGSKGTIEDKLRLFLIYWLCNDKTQTDRINQLISILASHINADNSNEEKNDSINRPNIGINNIQKVSTYFGRNGSEIKALKYLESHRKLMALGRSTMHSSIDESKESLQSLTSQMTSMSMNWGSKLTDMLGKVKDMLPLPGECVVTKITKRLMNIDSALGVGMNFTSKNPHLKDLDKNYVTFDPVYMYKNKVEIGGGMSSMNSSSGSGKYYDPSVVNVVYDNAIVFMVGGGCLSEFANLMEFGERKNKNIIYGCTDLVTPNSFLNTLTEMADD